MRTRGTGRAAGSLFLILFGLPFAAVGVIMGVVLARSIAATVRAQGWVETPASIVRTDLEVNRGSDSTTYRATAAYRYTFDGRSFEGDRVSFSSGADNVGSFHQRVHDELAKARDSGRPFRCYVNPANPAESVLYRGVRVEMALFFLLFVLVFGGAGLGMMIGGCVAGSRARRRAQDEAGHPDEPWLWKQEWADGAIPSSGKTVMVTAILFAVFWNLVSMPLLAFLPAEVFRKGNHAAAFGFLFPLVGLGLLAWAAVSVARWRKFGQSVFRMASVPGVIGGPLSGVVSVPVHLEPEDGFHATLSCVRRVTTGSGKHRHTSERILWQDERTLRRELLERDLARSAIPVLFGIPYDQPPTDERNAADTVRWRLDVRAKVPGLDYAAQFEVPVFRTAESSEAFQLDEAAIARFSAPVRPEQAFAAAGIRREPLPGGAALVFPAGRFLAFGLILLAVGLAMTGGAALLLRADVPRFIGIVVGLFGLLVLTGAAETLFRSSRVEVRRGALTHTTRLLWPGAPHTLRADEIRDIEIAQGGQYGNRVLFDIRAVPLAGRPRVLAKMMPDRQTADAVAAELRRLLRGA